MIRGGGDDQDGYIRTAHRVYKKSIKQICRETDHSRQTVRKVLRNEPFGYSPRAEQPYPVLGPYLQVIDQWLADDKSRPNKQRHTAKRIYDRLVRELHFKGADSTVRQCVRKAKIRLGVQVTPAFIPLEPDGGQEAEVDWGVATTIIAGEKVPVKFFCMRSKYSGKHFVRCIPLLPAGRARFAQASGLPVTSGGTNIQNKPSDKGGSIFGCREGSFFGCHYQPGT